MEHSAGRGAAAPEIKRKKTCTYILIAILCNILWGSAIPFINVGYLHQRMDIPVWQYMTALGLVCACIIIINYVPERGQTP